MQSIERIGAPSPRELSATDGYVGTMRDFLAKPRVARDFQDLKADAQAARRGGRGGRRRAGEGGGAGPRAGKNAPKTEGPPPQQAELRRRNLPGHPVRDAGRAARQPGRPDLWP